jgi:PPOX class probable F420-dependent enzyme
MGALSEKEAEFLDNPFVGVVTTLRRDGSPHSTVVWVDRENSSVSFNTARGRAKERHLKQDPRVSLIVVDPENSFRWVALTGKAQLVDDGAYEQMDRLAKKYLGQDEFPWRDPEQQRVKVLIDVDKVDASGFDE